MCTDRTPTSTEKTSPQERNAVRGKVVLKYGKVKKLGVARGHTCVTVGMWVVAHREASVHTSHHSAKEFILREIVSEVG